ncbi:putative toxin-antitoxin system toxin component, PIN family [Methyloversatilis sp.]|uniref:putative toxin-antitoxin system toxin component, PIN family n=1 Tax=Methyloversatilis sp. TaxID=2569862 RepID=UPI0027341EBB|nr:putative toxin-antitoxin system toxin component, PIN family [Methyloversatilis sp.]MDP2870115.1 putative toxin-antitoxin system toxin component, PIN family [Methyloversatilis sp.]MDP3454759.1 putative toxin-antitoxin system toxin component, PIN family [Methyloversatilis sp.]MDP3576834.1 putative toxin-antitoxin system toxin component, PIN family [Methyloversatilis sp.]
MAGRIRHAWQRGDYVPLVSVVTFAELVCVLAYRKFRLSMAEQEELLADYQPSTEVVRIPGPPPAAPDYRDLHDLPFLHLAAAARSDALVSGDADLLALVGQTSFHTVSPAVFVETLRHPLEVGVVSTSSSGDNFNSLNVSSAPRLRGQSGSDVHQLIAVMCNNRRKSLKIC